MVTRTQFLKLGDKIDELAAVLDPDDSIVRVVVFEGESPDFALAWHRRHRPEHAGRHVQLEYRNEGRHLTSDLAAVHLATAAERDCPPAITLAARPPIPAPTCSSRRRTPQSVVSTHFRSTIRFVRSKALVFG
jgi:hypothetical protein